MTEEQKNRLVKTRHELGLYSIKEICNMFGCGRTLIDKALKTGELDSMSPNNKERFVYLKDFMEFMKGGKK